MRKRLPGSRRVRGWLVPLPPPLLGCRLRHGRRRWHSEEAFKTRRGNKSNKSDESDESDESEEFNEFDRVSPSETDKSALRAQALRVRV